MQVAILVACIAFASAAAAEPQSLEREIKAQTGHAARVGVYTNIRPDCTSGPLPAIRLAAAPAHGKVIVKRGTLKATNFKQCLATEVPAFIAFYRAARDYSGADSFQLEVSLTGAGKRIEHFQVTVSSDPHGGQGI